MIAALEGGNAAAVDAARAGATPYVSPTVVAEFAAGNGDISALEAFLSARGGGVLAAETKSNAAALQAQAITMNRVLGENDAAIASAAQAVGIPVITADTRFLNFLIAIGSVEVHSRWLHSIGSNSNRNAQSAPRTLRFGCNVILRLPSKVTIEADSVGRIIE